ncbi:MAG: cytochrome c [Candidatus Tectomicrobia bacterium]
MRKASLTLMLPLLFVFAISSTVYAETVVEEFEIEGLISPASPKALKSALEEKLNVKVIGLNLKNTESGWPVIRVQFDSKVVSKDKIEQVIASTADPAGHKYKVHKGPLHVNAALLEEERKAIAILGSKAEEIPKLGNPIPASKESASRGKKLFEKNCARCHGLSGNGYGPSALAFTTRVRPLWVWNNADPSTDGYLFWFITNGRTDMPPWGVVLAENERWDLINYIKTLEAPK